MTKRMAAAMAVLVLAVAAKGVAEVGPGQGFARPAPAALKALRASVGKPFSAGWVFIDGAYIKPPYKVERWGTAIRINGIQATPELVPWQDFAKTQPGAVAVKTEIPVPESDDYASPQPSAAPEPPPVTTAYSESSLDDLFDDEPVPKKTPAPRYTAPRPQAPRKPQVSVTYEFSGKFEHNARTKELLARVNAERTRIDKALRLGGCFFFGSGYSTVSGDQGVAGQIVPKLPALLKNSGSAQAFTDAAAAAGLGYLPPRLLNDLYRNRIGYVQIEGRLRENEERKRWYSLP